MSYHSKFKPLEERIYRIKKPRIEFFCPLCRTKRAFVYSPRLSSFQYFQIGILGLVSFLIFFPLMSFRAGIFVFLYWGIFELVQRMLFKKEIPCPHCGFDATWYKRNVPKAKKIVETFWQKKAGDSLSQDNVSVDSLETSQDAPPISE